MYVMKLPVHGQVSKNVLFTSSLLLKWHAIFPAFTEILQTTEKPKESYEGIGNSQLKKDRLLGSPTPDAEAPIFFENPCLWVGIGALAGNQTYCMLSA